MSEEDKEKTAFTTHCGLFEWNVMPFGLTNAPAIFQELMSVVLHGMNGFSLAYLDDVIVFSPTLETHIQHLRKVFSRLREHNLKLKAKKCHFLQNETAYLGFTIDENGIKPSPEKVKAIKTLPAPTRVREVRSFIGMCSYYRRHFFHFSEIAEPLIKLTRKYARFQWTEACQKAFDQLKEGLTQAPLLAYPDVNKPYILYTDASDESIGACLTQPCDETETALPNVRNEKPIYYLSHRLSKTQSRWPIIEKEMFAIHYALSKLDYYLHNASFVIRTDHKPLKYILDSPIKNRKIQVWAINLAGYNCKIEFLPGSENNVADLLSRRPLEADGNESASSGDVDINDNAYQINTINSNQFNPKDYAACNLKEQDNLTKPEHDFKELDIVAEQAKDDEILELKVIMKQGEPTKTVYSKYLLIEDVVYYISDPDNEPILRLYVPTHLRGPVVKQYHDEHGHMGVQKTFDSIRLKYYWPNLYKQLYDYIDKCTVCQQRNLQKVKNPLQESDIPPYAFAKVSIDISGPYPQTMSGNKYIFLIVDWYSGWPEAFALPDKTADSVAHVFIDELIPRFSTPLQVVSDSGGENMGKAMQETLKALNVDHITTSFYHAAANGRAERLNKTLASILSKRVSENPQTWDLYLNQALAAIRFSVSESSKFSPFFLLYSRDPVLPVDNILKPRRKYHGEEMHRIALEAQHKAFTLVHRHYEKAKKRQAKYADKNSKVVKFDIGDPVYLKNHRRTNKLDKKWIPFYRIIAQKSPLTYLIKNQLDGSTIKSHAEHLRLAKIDRWEIPEQDGPRPRRKAAYAVPPESSGSSSSSDTDDALPLAKLAKKYRRERSNSDSEDDIPLLELRKRLKAKEARLQEQQDSMSDETTVPMSADGGPTSDIRDSFESNDESVDDDPDDAMEVGTVKKITVPKLTKTSRRRREAPTNKEVDKLRKTLRFVCGMI